MFWLIPVGVIGVGIAKLLYDVVSENERAAYENWNSKRIQVEKSIQEHQKNIERHIKKAQSSYDYHFLVDLHYSSVKVADVAYKLLDDARKSLAGINKMLEAAKNQKLTLQNTLETAKAKKDKKLIYDTIEQLKIVNELRKNAFEEKEKLKEQKDNFFSELQRLNNQTRELKLCIRDRCGLKGRDWFNKLEARKRLSIRF